MTTDVRQAPARTDTRVWLRDNGVYVAIAVLVVYNLVFTENFATVANLNTQLVQVAPILIVALGMALVIGTEGVDLSVGSVMAIAAAILPLYLGYGLVPAIGLALVAGALCGMANGTLVAVVGIQPIVATLALLVGGRGLALVFADGQLKDIRNPELLELGAGKALGVPYIVLIAALLAVLVWLLVRYTTFGRQLVAIGGNRSASGLAGLPVRRVLMLTYVISGVLAAVAGVLATARLTASDPSAIGNLFELSAITAVVVGGTPLSGGRVRILGTVAGAVLMQLITATLIKHDLPDSTAQIVQAAIIVVAVYLQRSRSGGPRMTTTEVAAQESIATNRTTRRERVAGLVQRRGSIVVLALVVLIASFSFDSFATLGNAQNIAIQSSFLAIVALGMTFVIISGGIDLSVGSVYALGGVLAAYGIQWGSLVGLLLPLVVCGAIGLLNGWLVAYGRLAPFIVTLATLLGARGLLLAITDEGSQTRLMPRDDWLTKVGQGTFLGLGIPVWITVVLFAIGMLVLQRTRFGHATFAIGGSREAATLMGLPVARNTMLLYLGSGLCAGLAGALAAAYSASGVTIVGEGLELDAIAAVVIGGTLLTGGAGTVAGTLAGVLLLRVIQNVINQIGTLSSHYQSVVSGAFLAVVVAVQAYLSRASR